MALKKPFSGSPKGKQPPAVSKLTLDQLKNYIEGNSGRFGGMSQDELKDWISTNWEAYQDQGKMDYYEKFSKYQQQQEQEDRDNLFGMFSESPQYEIPDEVFQKMDIFRQTAAAGLQGAVDARGSAMATLRHGISESLDTLGQAREESLGMAEKDVARIRDIQTRSRDAALDQAYAARKETLAELQRGGEKGLDIMRLQAFGGLPGERITQEQMSSNFAATQQAIKERAGGGSGALGAIAQGYGAQQGAQRQLAVDRAQYQAEGMGRLAEGEFAQSGRMAGAMRQSRMDIAGTEMATAKGLSDAYLDTSKYYTGMVGDYAGQISGTQMAGGQMLSGLDMQSSQAVIDAAYRGAGMVGQGLDAITAQRQQQFAINQYEPYIAQRQFLQNELQRLDPFGTQAQYYGDMIGMNQSQYLAGIQGQNQASNNAFNSFGNMMGNVGMWGLMGGGGGSTFGGNRNNSDSWGSYNDSLPGMFD